VGDHPPALEDHQNAFGGCEVLRQCDDLLAALGDDHVGDGEEVAVLAQALGDESVSTLGTCLITTAWMRARNSADGRPITLMG
jgi:hypothetical protein